MPIWLIGLALRASGWARAALRWLLASATHPALAACALLALWGWLEHRTAAKWQQQAHNCAAARKADRTAAEQAKAQAEADYRSKAHAADISYQAGLQEGDARLAAYIAAHRVQPAAQTLAARPAEDRGAAVSANPAPGAIVAATGSAAPALTISEADLRRCDADYAYARAAYDWARSLAPKP